MVPGMRERGQASVELMAVLPVVAVLVAAAWQAAVAGQAIWLSGGAARAAARAHAVGGDVGAAAPRARPPRPRRPARRRPGRGGGGGLARAGPRGLRGARPGA